MKSRQQSDNSYIQCQKIIDKLSPIALLEEEREEEKTVFQKNIQRCSKVSN
jgi:hypothetical protein